jgi:hypothetical protein
MTPRVSPVHVDPNSGENDLHSRAAGYPPEPGEACVDTFADLGSFA